MKKSIFISALLFCCICFASAQEFKGKVIFAPTIGFSYMTDKEKAKAYWKENIRYVLILMFIWFIVSFGAGILFHSSKWYAGLSIPKMINHDLNNDTEFAALERVHYYAIGGYVFDLNENLKLKKQFKL